jgi:hypothetical protein
MTSLDSWDPSKFLKDVSAHEVNLSRGFLRAQPGSWFPGMMAHWGALFYTFGVEAKVVEVKPVIALPRGLPFAFGALMDKEPLGVFLDDDSARVIRDVLTPEASPTVGSVVLEYLVRRLLLTLGQCWSGPSLGKLTYDPDSKIRDAVIHGGVKLGMRINQQTIQVWFALGPSLVAQFDKLWRKQEGSGAVYQGNQEIRVEIAQLGVPPSEIPNYVKPRTVVDLEIPVNDTVIVRNAGKPLFAAKLIDVEGSFGFEVIPGTPPTPVVPEGMTRVGIEILSFNIDGPVLSELQGGSMYSTGVPLDDKVSLVVGGERVARAKLCSFEGRFAIAVMAS